MKLYSEGKKYKLYDGSMLDMLECIEPNSIESIVTDPPYELNFMGKGWDRSGIAFQASTWEKCLTVLKPGGYLLAFGGSRTYHRIACAIEDAGFEIRDTIIWMYGSGFPKSMNIGLAIDKKNGVESEVIGTQTKGSSPLAGNHDGMWCDDQEDGTFELKRARNEWAGWGTSLKPAYEPVIIARKPCEGSCIDNVLKYGVGGINLDECRIPLNSDEVAGIKTVHRGKRSDDGVFNTKTCGLTQEGDVLSMNESGRFPSNIILTYDETDYDEVCGGMPDSKGATSQNNYAGGHIYRGQSLQESSTSLNGYREWYNDEGSASRYFYCAKASAKDRDEGLEDFEVKSTGELQGGRKEGSAGSIMQNADGGTRVNPYAGTGAPKKNTHPTVKPCELMQYLIRLVTPKGGTVLDPFNGSGSTGKACMYENRERQADYKYIGIELTPEYLPIADARIKFVESRPVQFKLF